MEEAGCLEMRRMGKMRMLWEECVKLWAEEEEQQGRGRIKMDLSSLGLNREKSLSLSLPTPPLAFEFHDNKKESSDF
ncbi:hypothetical protein AMTR_s00064p00150810 [Amborella trichopoda]|uniref:Uncharacterized protein n=1 Tax=Amborella trichopoda TaxID=13333 RepID=U5D2E1_AMBTC|nr:hypothetical protein AMTR_s00064p00150810 [Amborella trichopoda]